MRFLRTLAAATLSVALAACATVEQRVPALELPSATTAAPADIDRWWLRFGDAQLAALIEQALANNVDLQLAIARIDEARANLRIARSTLFPDVNAVVGASRAQRSDAVEPRFPGPLISNRFNAGLQASYEVDLWGRLASGRDASAAALLATRYSAETVRTVLAAEVARAYFTLRAFDAELQITRDAVGTRAENVQLQRQRFDAGLIGEYELQLADAERATVAATIPPLERAIAQTEAALAVLTGRSPREIYAPSIARGGDWMTAAAAPDVPPGLPSDLLARRPDIRQAEASLAAANFDIAAARAQYFPLVSLTASLGSESSQLSNLFSGPATVWSLAGGLLQPIFNAGRIGAQVDAATARRQQAELAYVGTVQLAFRDVHDALVAHRTARDSLVAQDERRARFADAANFADQRHRGGYTSYLEVLDAQRNLLDADRARVAALRDRQTALIDLYKAIGGGWSPEQIAQSR
jgi:outer membrane protein, multidrug efflux system